MNIKSTSFTVWYAFSALIALLVIQSMFSGEHTQTLTYSQFKSLLRAGKLQEVVVGDDIIKGTVDSNGLDGLLPKETLARLRQSETKPGVHRFATVRVQEPQLVQELEAAKVDFSAKPKQGLLATLLPWIVPAFLFYMLWYGMNRGMAGAHGMMDIGKSKAKVFMEKQTGVTFEDVAGIDEAEDELREVVEFLKSPERYRRLGGHIPKGVLIVGAPGTGKTLLAKAVAGEAGVPFFSISGSEFVEMFVGVGAARVRDLFEQAERHAPCIIFIDELDALGKARGFNVIGGHDEREQTLNQLLVEMDGFDSNKGVIILAATNRPEILDPALLRPGRFDRHVTLYKPDLQGRLKILEVHTRKVKLAAEVTLEKLAAMTPGFAGADLANLVNEAALRAARQGKDGVEMVDFEEALERIVAGLERKNRVMNAKERQTVAHHEAGHALVAENRASADRVAKISIIPRGVMALGYTQQMPTEERYVLRESELLDRIDVLLGGRVAEELIFGEVSTGAQNDLQRATDIARRMITQYGMSQALGLATFEEPRTTPFLGVDLPREAREYSERTARMIDHEIARLLAQAHARVKETLTEHRRHLEALAGLLLEREVVDRAALEVLLSDGETAGSRRAAFVKAHE